MPKLLGHEVSQGSMIAGAGALVFTAGYAIWRYEHKKKATAAASTTPTSTGGYAYGYGYGSQYYGYGFGYGAPVNEAGAANEWEYGYGEYGYGYYDPATGQYLGAASGSVNTPPVNATPSTNAEWSIAATNELVAQGYSAATVAAALGPYLQAQPLSANQVGIVQAALAYTGDPPVPGTGAQAGYPPAYHTAGTTGGGTGGGQTNPPGPTKVTVPRVLEMRGEDARKAVESLGLHWKQTPSTTPKGKSTTVKTQSPKAGTKVNSGSTVSVTLTVK